tara:strand:+ start:551 stop:730 length:180 start_codon:yes stop_codon:yes gene_type:complete
MIVVIHATEIKNMSFFRENSVLKLYNNPPKNGNIATNGIIGLIDVLPIKLKLNKFPGML